VASLGRCGLMQALFDPDAGGPAYLYAKLADHLMACIEDGSIPPGAMLPNERCLAVECEVSVGTVRRATRLLRDRGLVVTLPGRGSFVVATGSSPAIGHAFAPADDGSTS
jgi:GntR family transcriptional regulator